MNQKKSFMNRLGRLGFLFLSDHENEMYIKSQWFQKTNVNPQWNLEIQTGIYLAKMKSMTRIL